MVGQVGGHPRTRPAILFGTAFPAALVLTLVTAQAAEPSPQLQQIIKLAQQEKRIQVVGTQFGAADGVRIAEAGVKKMFGVDLSIEFAPGAAMAVIASKLYEEFQAGQKASSDVFAATAIQLGPYQDKGFFKKIPWEQLMPERITSNLVESDGQALRVETQTPGILYNVKSAAWAKDVKVMADLLKPEYRGKFVTTPYLAGFDVLVAKEAWGAERSVDYIRKFSSQISGFVNCASESRIASGEVPALALDCVGGAQNIARYKQVLDLQIVTDAAQRRYIYLTIPGNSAHPNAAILYALYLLSPEGQGDVALNLDGSDLDNFPGSKMGQRIEALETQSVRFTTVDFTWWQRNYRDVQPTMRELVEMVRRGG